VVVIIESHAAACGFEEISVLVFATVDRLGVKARLTCYVDKANSKRSTGDRGGNSFGCSTRHSIVSRARSSRGKGLGILLDCQSEYIVKREN
jgi:hypothetical protein